LKLPILITAFYQFQIKDYLKAAKIEAARRTEEYVEQPERALIWNWN